MRINIFVGTVYGNSLLVAEEAEYILSRYSHKVTIYTDPVLDDWKQCQNEYILIVTSTTNRGNLPDNIISLYQAIKTQMTYQLELRYGIIALGDSSYKNFCGGGKKFDALLQKQGAKRIGEMLLIDATKHSNPEYQSNLWIEHWIKLLN